LLALQIVFIRYLGAMPVLIGFLVYALNKKRNVMVLYNRKDFAILLISVLLSAIGINYLWITGNQTLSNLLLQTILAMLPLVVGVFNVIGNKTSPSLIFMGSCLVAIVGVFILFM
jgi:drug/metabolite transporter (DMT)-like permease